MFGLFQKIPSISTTELAAKLATNIEIIDVRTPSEYRSGHIAKAKNVPLANITSYSGPKNKPVHVVCQSGMRSKNAANILKKNGYDVINIRGGMNHWSGKITGGK